MIKTLKKHGNSQALVFDRALVELMEIDEHTPLKIQINNNIMTITPIRQLDVKEQVAKSLRRTNKRYGPALKNMAE